MSKRPFNKVKLPTNPDQEDRKIKHRGIATPRLLEIGGRKVRNQTFPLPGSQEKNQYHQS